MILYILFFCIERIVLPLLALVFILSLPVDVCSVLSNIIPFHTCGSADFPYYLQISTTYYDPKQEKISMLTFLKIFNTLLFKILMVIMVGIS